MRKVLLGFYLLFLGYNSHAQELDTLRFEVFMKWVESFHPMASQAEIYLGMGEMEVRKARGGFDPLLYGTIDQKDFSEKTYYDKREAGLKIPTVAGIELNGAFEQNSGQFLNPENSVPSGGLLAAGASLNLGQGLILDERRAALRQAQLYQQSTESERVKLLNELYLKGYEAYWNWSLAFSNLLVLQEGYKLTLNRYEGVRQSFFQGDLAAIDTVEAFSQLLNRQYKLQSAENAYFKATQELNSYLWNEGGEPMVLDQEILPQVLGEIGASSLDFEALRTSVGNHPELIIADYELAGLGIEKKLKAQSLLPVVKLKYNFLVEDLGGFGSAPFFENNYKWGISAYTPLLWRKARGSVALANAKIDFKQNSRDLKELQLRTKLESELNSWEVLSKQVNVFKRNVDNLDRLLDGELRKFEIGESSLFLVNAREVSVLDSRITLNELLAKQKLAFGKARFAAGLGF
ncbi:TolC family protein [Algoriphagus sp. CAU 1675]|uniref:TolC family protein n=1 Tax=Algoriphagus sp. CAU 1675 TaxID=3032597 RepID=UPI0023D9E5E8|nr:TolC family protein [Algoriphagus sp. CAU 1675]MDF2158011.1 TolC family protein [Algoriphagus sp. CAU 1675]